MVHHYPRVIGGICEWCGVKDRNQPSEVQYTLCDHFKTIGQLQCSYCPDTANPVEVVAHANLLITDHPTNPNEMVVCCDSFTCTQKHQERFKISA